MTAYIQRINDILAYFSGCNVVKLSGRYIKIHSDDTFLVSYPRSGNGWMRYLLFHLLYPSFNSESLLKYHRQADIYKSSDKTLRSLPSPRLLKSHESFMPHYGKVIYLVRDPRSVAGSYYQFLKMQKNTKETDIDTFIESFIKGSIDTYGTWAEHVLSWTAAKEEQTDKFLLLKYEDVYLQPEENIQKIIDFMGLEISAQQVESALHHSSYEVMKNLRVENLIKRGTSQEDAVKQLAINSKEEQLNKWQKIISPKLCDYIENSFQTAMKKVGYID